MLQSITESPMANLADLFLDAIDNGGSQLALRSQKVKLDQSFRNILQDNLQRSGGTRSASSAHDSGQSLGDCVETTSRRNPLEELQYQIDGLGLPLDSMSLREEDIPRLRKVLSDTGLDETQIQSVMAQLARGELTMDRVMAAIGSLNSDRVANLTLSESSIPLLGRLLQDLGLKAETVNDITRSLKAGQKFSAETLRDILLKHGQSNLKGLDFSGVDVQNLSDLLTSLGVKEQDLDHLLEKLDLTQGRLSVEGFLGFLKSITRPAKLTSDQQDNIARIVDNLLLNNSIRARVQFDRTMSLLLSMGDQEIDENFVSNNPAIQALRGGAISAENVVRGGAEAGRGAATGADGIAGSGTGSGGTSAASSIPAKGAEAGLTSRLSDSIIKQVADKMLFQVRNGQQQLRVNLNPPELGRININIVMKQSGLQASIIAESSVVRDALEGQIHQLRAALAEQGLDLERFDVFVAHDQQQSASGWRRSQSPEHERARTLNQESLDESAEAVSTRLNGNNLVDLLA